jgi:hypothetical protein
LTAGDVGKYFRVSATGSGSYAGTVTSNVSAAGSPIEITGYDALADIDGGTY